jgi:hypothetical protein
MEENQELLRGSTVPCMGIDKLALLIADSLQIEANTSMPPDPSLDGP